MERRELVALPVLGTAQARARSLRLRWRKAVPRPPNLRRERGPRTGRSRLPDERSRLAHVQPPLRFGQARLLHTTEVICLHLGPYSNFWRAEDPAMLDDALRERHQAEPLRSLKASVTPRSKPVVVISQAEPRQYGH